MNSKSPAHPNASKIMTVHSPLGLCLRVVIVNWYRDAFACVAEQATALESDYIERGSRGATPLSQIYANPADLRQDQWAVLAFAEKDGKPLLVHTLEIIDVDQRLYEHFNGQFRDALEAIGSVALQLAKILLDLGDTLPLVPIQAGTLAALAQKAGRLYAFMQENRNCTNPEHLKNRATLGKKIAVELAQEFAAFRYQLLQARSRAVTEMVQKLGQLDFFTYHLQFGTTEEQDAAGDLATVIAKLLKDTAELRLPILDLAEHFENADIPLAEYNVLAKLCADSELATA